jgi:CDP-diacylglycerol--serine O-phosphatidyltransferase
MSMIKLLKLKDYITLTGTICGVLALIAGILIKDISLGFFLVMICQGTDLLDGYVARKFKQKNEIGKEIDSLSDSFCFGVVPAILILIRYSYDSLFKLFFYVPAVIIFILCAILRLARFNVKDEKGYTGLVTPLSALMVLLFYFIDYYSIQTFGEINLISNGVQFFFPFLLVILGYLNITTYVIYGAEIKMKGGYIKYIFIGGGILTIVIAIIGLTDPTELAALPLLCLFIVFFILEWIYIIIGFKNYINFKKNLKNN